MSWFSRLSSLDKQLVGVIGGYSVVALGFSVKGEKKPEPKKTPAAAAAAPATAASHVSASAPAAAKDCCKSKCAGTAAPASFQGKNDPMVLFALQDIQSRLAVIEKALNE